MQNNIRRGYLHENYRLFHSSDRRDMDFQSHNHDFHKIVLCLDGRVTYIMEGSTYFLSPWDVLIIPQHQIHRSIMSSEQNYERIILWINDSFLRGFDDAALTDVFEKHRGLFRPLQHHRGMLIDKLLHVEQYQKAAPEARSLLADTYLLQFLLELGNLLENAAVENASFVHTDPKFTRMLAFINQNLGEDLSIERISREFFMSKSYLMHRFREMAGCSVHQYVQQKRLVQAAKRIREGEAVISAAMKCGFNDYSAFLKAFRKMYGFAPGQLKKSGGQEE